MLSYSHQHLCSSHTRACFIDENLYLPLRAGLTMHASILAYMFSLVEQGKITVKLHQGQADNVVFVQEYVANLLKTAFSHLQE